MKATQDKLSESTIERRQGNDRRHWICHHDFPYVDTHGILVVRNRRKDEDRRHPTETLKEKH